VKIAWFRGDVHENEAWDGSAYSLEELLAMPRDDPRAPVLRILLVPDDADTSGLWGDDWNDRPANCNAGDPYERTYPPGAIMVEAHVGDILEISDLVSVG